MIEILNLFGEESRPFLPELASLRIRVFREYPYLYDGNPDYETNYLAEYFSTPESVLVLARDSSHGAIVGASTAMPLAAADPAFQSPLATAGFDLSKIFYFGESVLLPDYRGRGIGHQFFDHRETVARGSGFQTTAFCAVIRPENHPVRPHNYRPHDAFWSKRGYRHFPEIRVSLNWREPGNAQETDHSLSFWIREWEPDPSI